MSLNIKGEYSFRIPIITMFLNTEMVIKGTNLITFLGEKFFLRRCIDDTYSPLEYIVIGTGVNAPNKKDESLGNETKRENTVKEIDNENNRIVLTSSFLVGDLVGITEIGVCNIDNVLISHDTFNETALTEDFLYGVVGSVRVEYIFQFSTSQIKTGWSKKQGSNNTYYVYEPNMVQSVMDNTNRYGLKRLSAETDIDAYDNMNSYFYDSTKTNNLYIHLQHEVDTNGLKATAPNPNDYEIIIENK